VQGAARRLCLHGYRVRYTTSADLVKHLASSRADNTLARRLRELSKFDLLILDEFGFEKLERLDCPQAANLLYKVIEARYPRRSTALVTNIDFEAWSDYLGDPPLAMAFLDRVVDGAIILKLEGNSYRAHRAKRLNAKPRGE
jgi:DNA replication protein DnaC